MINKIFLVSFFFFSLNISSNQFSDKEVRNMLIEVNSEYAGNLPIRIDSETLHTGMKAGYERNLINTYRLTSITANTSELSIFKDLVINSNINNYCTSPGLAFYRKENIALHQHYHDLSNKFLFLVKVNKNDC